MKITTYQQSSARPSRVWRNLIPALLLCLLASVHAQAQYDLGTPAYSTLTWQEIRGGGDIAYGIGLTVDGRVYVWGDNAEAEIHTKKVKSNEKQIQSTPFYVPLPNGEVGAKVNVTGYSTGIYNGYGGVLGAGFACLTQSGKLYGWGINSGIFGDAAWPVSRNGGIPNLDTLQARRKPVLIPVPGETTVQDFAMGYNSLIVIGGSGKAYYNGPNFVNNSPTYTSTFRQIPFPSGVTGYKKAWIIHEGFTETTNRIFLKGNDNNIYAAGDFSISYASGVAALNTLTSRGYDIGVDVPLLVPFPAGEEIVDINTSDQTSIALSKSGKAYGAGLWYSTVNTKISSLPGLYGNTGVCLFPLKTIPAAADIFTTIVTTSSDTTIYTTKFLEIALPTGATKFINIENTFGLGQAPQLYFVTDNNKVYWRGVSNLASSQNFLQHPNLSFRPECSSESGYRTTSRYSFVDEAINLRGATRVYMQNFAGFVISSSGRGYAFGSLNSPMAPLGQAIGAIWSYPVPFANELLDLCSPSPGVGGPGGGGTTTGTSSATGVIDCSKTQIVSAPIAGSANQHALIVTITVSATGVFAPISVTGSGMSLANGVSSVDAPKIGTQQFQIPIQYDGTALTNGFTFTVGTAGGCTADLTQSSQRVITDIWKLTNCTAIVPGTLSK